MFWEAVLGLDFLAISCLLLNVMVTLVLCFDTMRAWYLFFQFRSNEKSLVLGHLNSWLRDQRW